MWGILVIQLVPIFPSISFALYFTEQVLEFIGMYTYLFAIIFAQDVYFFTKIYYRHVDCTVESFGATRTWLELEIAIFYGNFIVTIAFLVLSELFLKGTGIKYEEKKEKQGDFLRKYRTWSGLYQTYGMMLTCSCYLLWYISFELDQGFVSPQFSDESQWIYIVTILCHVLQFAAINTQMFIGWFYRKNYARALNYVQIVAMIVIPLATVFCQFIWLLVNDADKFDSLPFKYVQTDMCLNIVSSVTYVIALERIIFEQKESSEMSVLIEDRDKIQKKTTPGPSKLSIGADYYALSYCSFIKHYRDKFNISNEEKSMFFVNCCFIFFMQVGLVLLAYLDMTNFQIDDGKWFVMLHTDTTAMRILLAYVSHLIAEPEIRQGLCMWKYVLNHYKAKGSFIELYKKTCGKMHPLPEDPKLITREILV